MICYGRGKWHKQIYKLRERDKCSFVDGKHIKKDLSVSVAALAQTKKEKNERLRDTNRIRQMDKVKSMKEKK